MATSRDIKFGANHYGLTWDQAIAAVIDHDEKIRHPHFADNAFLYRGPDQLIWLSYPAADFDGVYTVSAYDKSVIDWYTIEQPGKPSTSAPRKASFDPVAPTDYTLPEW